MSPSPDAITRKRVKFYILDAENNWEDRGTGYLSTSVGHDGSTHLLVVSEKNGTHLLQSIVHPHTAYQRQEDTLIVWNEKDTLDLALSFQEETGCQVIWEMICGVQGKDPSVDITQDITDDDAEEIEDIETDQISCQLPLCELLNLVEIRERIEEVIPYPLQREKHASLIIRENYLKKLTDIFHKAESKGDLGSLHNIYGIVRSLLLFNQNCLYELIFSDEYIIDVAGMLEYSPEKRFHHREILRKRNNFKEIIKMKKEITEKIHKTYSMQYIHDFCLPLTALFEASNYSNLTSLIRANKFDIVNKLISDVLFLEFLFSALLNRDTPLEIRRNHLNFLKEFCEIIQSMPIAKREPFMTRLIKHDILKSILLSYDSSSVDILQIFIDSRIQDVRNFFVNDRPVNGSNSVHLNILIDQLILNIDSEKNRSIQILAMLRALFGEDGDETSVAKNERYKFINYFYQHSMQLLLQPVVDLVDRHDHRLLSDSLVPDLLDLIVFCLKHQASFMRTHLLRPLPRQCRDTMLAVTSLLQSNNRLFVVGAVKVIRRFLVPCEEVACQYVLKNDVIDQLIDLLDCEHHWDGLLHSLILELFASIAHHGLMPLVTRVVVRHWPVLEKYRHTSVFVSIKHRYDAAAARLARKATSIIDQEVLIEEVAKGDGGQVTAMGC